MSDKPRYSKDGYYKSKSEIHMNDSNESETTNIHSDFNQLKSDDISADINSTVTFSNDKPDNKPKNEIKTKKQRDATRNSCRQPAIFKPSVPESNRAISYKTKKKMKLWKKILFSVLAIILSLAIIASATYTYLFYQGSKEMLVDNYEISVPEKIEAETENNGEYITYKGKKYEYNKNMTNILCMGIDKREIDSTTENGTGGQADVIILLALDTSTGKITMLNVSRELMTNVRVYSAQGNYIGTNFEQICLSYAYGDGKETSCENVVKSVQQVFYNIPIMSYFALDLDGISVVNDSIGGVDVKSPETIAGFIKGETYHLEGKMAEDFIQKRSFEIVDANNYRNIRQKIYIQAFMKKAIKEIKSDFTTFIDLYNASSDYSCTNINLTKASYLAGVAISNNNTKTQILNVPGTIKKGERYAEYYIDEEKFYEIFLDVFYKPVLEK